MEYWASAVVGISIVLCFTGFKIAELKYGSISDIQKINDQLTEVQKQLAQAKKDRLHERVSAIEAKTGTNLF